MPFDPSHPPAKLKNLTEKQKKIFISAFNSCWEKDHDDEKCHKIAWAAAGKAKKADCPSCMVSDNENPNVKDAPCWAGELVAVAKSLLG